MRLPLNTRRCCRAGLALGVFLASCTVQSQQATLPSPAKTAPNQRDNAPFSWDALSSQLAAIAKDTVNDNSQMVSGDGSYWHLTETAVLPGVGPVAFMDVGGMGASADGVVLVRAVGGKATPAVVTEKDGGTGYGGLFLSGSSVMHSDDAHFEASKGAFYTIRLRRNEKTTKVIHCDIDAYQWSAASESFHWSRTLTRELQRSKCP